MSITGRLTLAVLLVVAARAGAQTCDPRQGATFGFAASTHMTSLAIKTLVPKVAGSPKLVGTGTLTLADGTLLPVAVTARARSGRKITETYRFSAKTATARVRGSILTQGCPAALAKVRVTLKLGTTKVVIKDPTLVGMLASLGPDTILLDPTDVGGLTVDPTDPTRVLLPSGDPLLAAIHVGTVLLAGITPATPQGLLVIVTAIDPGVATTTLLTMPGTLDDAFDTLDVEVGSGAATGMSARGIGPRLKFDGSIDVQVTQDVQHDFTNDLGPDSLLVQASVTVGAGLALGIHTGHKYLVVPTLKSAHAELTGTLTIAADASSSGELSISAPGKSKFLPSLDVGPPVEIAPGVVVQPALEIDGGVEASFASAFDAHGQLSVDVLLGVQCHGTSCSPEMQATPTADGGVTIDAGASVGVFVEPAVAFKIDQGVSLVIGPKLAVDLNADIAADPWWTLEGTLAADVAVDVDLGIVDFTPIDLPFDLLTATLAEAPGPFAGTTTTTSTSSSTSTSVPIVTTTTVPAGVCGNGQIDAGEQCDTGAANGTVGSCCAADCTLQPNGTFCFIDGFGPGRCNGVLDSCIFTIF